MDITKVINENMINLNLKGRTKEEVLDEMSDLLFEHGILTSKEEFLKAMEEDQRHYDSLTAILKEAHKKEWLRQGMDEKQAAKKAEKQAIEDARAVGESLHQPGVGHQLQMARDARLALIQHAGQLHDRQFLARQQRQHPQPGRLAGGAQGLHGLVGGQGHGYI